MRLSDPEINTFVEQIQHIIDRGRPAEEVARIAFQLAYARGFERCARAETRYSKFVRYWPAEKKACPKCGYKGGA